MTAEDLMRWHSKELSLKADSAKPVEKFAEMIKEVGWEMDDEDHKVCFHSFSHSFWA